MFYGFIDCISTEDEVEEDSSLLFRKSFRLQRQKYMQHAMETAAKTARTIAAMYPGEPTKLWPGGSVPFEGMVMMVLVLLLPSVTLLLVLRRVEIEVGAVEGVGVCISMVAVIVNVEVE